jgi:hypothetical protein
MFKIIHLKGSQRRSHIAKGVRRGKTPKSTLCGRKFKWTQIEFVTDDNVEACSCQRCITVLNTNPDLALE